MIRVEINETENMNRDTETSEDQKLDFFFLINKTDQSSATLTKKEWKKTPISKISSRRGHVTEVERIVRAFCEQIYTRTLGNL
jgi:hypothetical protein